MSRRPYIIDTKGERWEIGAYRPVGEGEDYLHHEGVLTWKSSQPSREWRLVVYKVPIEHVYGGVVWRETGENRPPKEGEAFLVGDRLAVAVGSYFNPRIILKPVRIVQVANI